MFIMKLMFAVLIFVCAAFYLLYIWDFSLILLIVVAALPAVMFILLLIAKRSISVKFAVKSTTVSKNENFDIQLCVENRSILPIGKAEAFIEYYNIFNNQINTLQLDFPVQARNSQRVTFQFSSKFSGMLKIRTAYINIYDPLRIFRMKTGKNIREEICVLPEGHEINGIVTASDRITTESPAFSEHRPGDDPSEVFDLRDYIPGDKLNRIHWKLSSKRDDFIVKDYSLPIDSSAVLFLDLHCTEDSDYTLPVYDTLLELLVSLSQFMLENERAHKIIYYSHREKEFVSRTINGMDSLSAAVNELIHSLSDDLYAAQPDEFLASAEGAVYTSFTFITAEGSERLLEYLDEDIDADIKNAVIAVKNPQECSLPDKAFSSLNTIPVVIGRITSSVKDIEL